MYIIKFRRHHCFPFFFFNDTATTEIYTLSLHDALPISFDPYEVHVRYKYANPGALVQETGQRFWIGVFVDRKSTRLNSSHVRISYAVFCLKKKKKMSELLVRTSRYRCLDVADMGTVTSL